MFCYTFMARLIDAYKAQESVKDRELLLSALKCGKNQRYLAFTFLWQRLELFGRNWRIEEARNPRIYFKILLDSLAIDERITIKKAITVI